MMKHLVGRVRNGAAVYVDLVHSEAAKSISMQPYLLGLAREAIGRTTLKGDGSTLVRDMGRSIGYNFVVPTNDASKVFYAKALRDDVYMRFVKEGKPLSTQFLTLSLKRHETDDDYDLLGVWAGKVGPPRPGSADETVESKIFWANHAYVFDKQSLQSHTITKTCPY
jgi:hypothetical protein